MQFLLAASKCLDSRFNSSGRCCPNFLLLYDLLTFIFKHLTSQFYQSVSVLFLSVLCGKKPSMLVNITALKLFHISSTLIPFLALIPIYPG